MSKPKKSIYQRLKQYFEKGNTNEDDFRKKIVFGWDEEEEEE